MTTETGIRCANSSIEHGVRYPEAVVRAIVFSHVVPPRHMAQDTLRTGSDFKQNFAPGRFDGVTLCTFLLMKMVLRGVVLRSPVTLQAKIIPLLDQLDRVHVMAVVATHIMAVHFALGERAINVNLIHYLAVSKVKIFA